MAFRGLKEFIEVLENEKELIRVKEYVDPILEIAEITDRISKTANGGKALLFENTGTDFPLLINSMGSLRRINIALGVNKLDEIGGEIRELIKDVTSPKSSFREKIALLPKLNKLSSWMPGILKSRGRCQEVINMDPDLSSLPVLKCWPLDAGRFITFPLVHTKDPGTGIRNVGMYRMQVIDKQTTGMHWHRHKVGARHFREYKDAGKKMPVAVALGGDPAYTYAATAPLPDNMDEYMLAGFLRKRKVELVKCITQDIEVPADADIIIEGYIDPTEDFFMEGPFGDHTGYYSLEDWYPKFHVSCITHKNDAVYPATIVGIPPQEDAYIAKATERIFLVPLQYSVIPELLDMEIPTAGVAHNLTIVKIKKDYPGQARKVMNALWGAGQMMLNKVLLVVDGSVDIHNLKKLAIYISRNFSPEEDVYFDKGPLDVLDHAASVMGYGGKMGIDATHKLPEELNRNDLSEEQQTQVGKIKNADFPGIVDVNNRLLKEGISILVIAVKKESAGQLAYLAKNLHNSWSRNCPKVLFLVDAEVKADDLMAVTWLGANNIDPQRDCWILTNDNGGNSLIIDGTRKLPGRDDFKRNWPNVIVSDEKTINKVDKKWLNLGLGEYLPSPSLEFKNYVQKGGAEVEE
ncbi:MAG: menaquinone biosynthesis decarboxylase [Bacteroidota bacterium]|nr:menaquinone biosynthesis decarboxylase [Bacteroidota bacterium]